MGRTDEGAKPPVNRRLRQLVVRWALHGILWHWCCCNSNEGCAVVRSYGIAVHLLQWVQNAAAYLLLVLPRRDHIQPALVELRWLPIVYRIKFKLELVITVHTDYFTNSVQACNSDPAWTHLRSASSTDYIYCSIDKNEIWRYGLLFGLPSCMEQSTSSSLWSRQFKCKIKTPLFTLMF